MTFNELVRALADEVGVPLSGEIDSPLEFTIDGLPITLGRDLRGGVEDIVLYALLGTVPEGRELEVYRVLLEANVLWSATADGTLGVNSATREVMICYRRPVEGLDGQSGAALLGAFTEVAENWRNFMEAVEEEGPLPTMAVSPDSSPMIRV
jgi:hypothetical protein